MKLVFFLSLLAVVVQSLTETESLESKADPNGYLFFCLCMGRFGNQAEHFLGGLAFAKSINRTLILPPWRTYKNIEFSEWFQVEPLTHYHRVISAEDFMRDLAPTVWPQEKRYGFCFQFSHQGVLCEVKQGNPFKNFWDELGVEFTKIIRHSVSYGFVEKWNTEFPATDYPVIALKGAPASFPVAQKDLFLQQFMIFSDKITMEAEGLLEKLFGSATYDYVAVHLRNGKDWERACESVGGNSGNSKFMSSYQCHDWDQSKSITKEMCFPSTEEILHLTKTVIEQENCSKLLICTDQMTLINEFREYLGPKIKIVHPDPWLPVVDVYLMSHSKHFIGNCISSFSAFATRQRKSHNIGPTSYFGVK